MRVLVTGAAGFLGSRVFSTLVEAGCNVVGVDAKPLPPSANASSRNGQFVIGDLWDDQLRTRVLGGVTAVCHLAAFIPPRLTDPSFAETCLRQNTLLTLELLRATMEAKAKHFVYCSFAGASDTENGGTADLDAAGFNPYFEAPFYLGSKLAGELWARYYAATTELKVAIVRPGSLYGVGMPARSAVAVFMRQAFRGLPLRVMDGGVAQFDYVFVDDVADLIERILRNGSTGVFNAGTGRGVTVLELAKLIQRLFPERKITINVEPASTRPRRGMPVCDIRRAQTELGYYPRSLEQGLRLLMEHMEHHPDEVGGF